jgi:hypothetical protein
VDSTGLQASGKRPLRSYSFLFGPTVRFTRSRFQPFANVLIGGVHLVANETLVTVTDASGLVIDQGLMPRADDTTFAWAIGGGADIPINKHFAIRTSADYLRTSFQDFNDDRQNHIRVFGGLVWRWYRD